MKPLGKRYIALLPTVAMRVDARSQYTEVIRNEHGDPVISHYRLHHNQRLYDTAGQARRQSNAYSRNHEGFGRVLEVDLDDLPVAGLTNEERYQYAERMLFKWCLEEQRLRPAQRAETDMPTYVPPDLRHLREAAAQWMAIRPWVDASSAGGEARAVTDRDLARALLEVLPKLSEDVRQLRRGHP